MSSAPITRALAAWLSSLRHEDVPPDVLRAIRMLTLDTLGAALAGRDQVWVEKMRSYALRGALRGALGGAPRQSTGLATIWGDASPELRPAEAALVNGTAAHAFELDDFHNAKIHPGAVVAPAAFALWEGRGAPAERLEVAVAAGYEVMIRTALALDPSHARLRGWHLTGVCGTLGAAAAASVLLGLTETETAWALGLAATQSGGLFAFNADGTMSKRLHPGRAAQSGILAAELAEIGFTGPTQVLEASDGGMLRAFSDDPHPDAVTDGLGHRWHAAKTSFKPYSCCGSLHSYVDAALTLRERWTPARRVRGGVARVVEVQCGYPYVQGSELNAQMSLRYCAAVALLDGQALPGQFTPERIADPELTAIAAKLEVVHDPELDSIYPGRFAGWLEIEDATGSFIRETVLDPSGHPSNPRRDEALKAKYRQLAAPVIGAAAAQALENAVMALGRANPAQVMALLAAGDTVGDALLRRAGAQP